MIWGTYGWPKLAIGGYAAGYKVSLSRDRWKTIVKYKHPSMADRLADVEACLIDPVEIRQSERDQNVHVYYRDAERGFVCVVAAPSDGDNRFVVTAYLTRNIKDGTVLWKK